MNRRTGYVRGPLSHCAPHRPLPPASVPIHALEGLAAVPASRRPVRLTDDEHLVVTARSNARHLGARLVLTPVDPLLYQELTAFLAGQGAAALAALSSLQALPADRLHARLAQVSRTERAAPAAHLELVALAGQGDPEIESAWSELDPDETDAALGDDEPWPYDEAGA